MSDYFPSIEHFNNLSSLPPDDRERHLKVKAFLLQGLCTRMNKLYSTGTFKNRNERHSEAEIITMQIDVLIKEIITLQNPR